MSPEERRAKRADYQRRYRQSVKNGSPPPGRRTKTAEEKQERRRKWLEANRERSNQLARKRRGDARREYERQWQSANKDRLRQSQREWRENHSDQIRSRRREWRINNPERIRAEIARRDPLPLRLRGRLYRALRGDFKTGSAVRDLGCTISELRAYLEAQFLPGMTWENWSLRGWHIDHIVPLSSFDLSDPQQFAKAVHYTNLRPLWATENLSKGARVAR